MTICKKNKDSGDELRKRSRKVYEKAVEVATAEGPMNQQWRANALVQSAAGLARLAEQWDDLARREVEEKIKQGSA